MLAEDNMMEGSTFGPQLLPSAPPLFPSRAHAVWVAPGQSQVGIVWRVIMEGNAQGLFWAEVGLDWNIQWPWMLALEEDKGVSIEMRGTGTGVTDTQPVIWDNSKQSAQYICT